MTLKLAETSLVRSRPSVPNGANLFSVFFLAGGILLSRPDDKTSVQLADFTNAITKSQIEDDCEISEMLREALPPETIPPEVCSA